ncbi:hemin receptor [Marinomonas sp. 42_23_T18]|nr:hemin receptor [Marinomonas sp. 42_23_T18]
MAITQRQKTLVVESFAKVEQISDVAATIFYKKLFEYDPSLKKLFKHDIKSQGRKLMSALKLAVSSLNDLEALVPVLQKMAVKHVDYGVKAEDYTPVGNALLFALAQGLGDAFTNELKQAWIAIYKTIATVMRQAAYPSFNPNTFRNTKNYVH